MILKYTLLYNHLPSMRDHSWLGAILFKSKEIEAGLPLTEHQSFVLKVTERDPLIANLLGTHTSDVDRMEVDPPAAKPLSNHTLLRVVILAAGILFAGHQIIDLVDSIRILSHLWFNYSLEAELEDLVPYNVYLPPDHTSSSVDLPDARSPQACCPPAHIYSAQDPLTARFLIFGFL